MSLIQTYKLYPITIVKGKGSYIYDENGREYLDFYGGHAVCGLGHCPDVVVEAIKKQAENLIFYSNVVKTKPNQELSQIISQSLAVNWDEPEAKIDLSKTEDDYLYGCYFANSGSEANETAIKICRKATGKDKIISFKNSFHGRSITSLGATGMPSYNSAFTPNLNDWTYFAELGNLEEIENELKTNQYACVICEPVQSVGGIKMASHEFYQKLAKLCEKYQTPLIMDEVQTGIGRTGKPWFSQKLGVQPDIITTAKALGSGLPISAVIVKKPLSQSIKVGDQATTFGGAPVPCAAASTTLKTIFQQDFLKQVQEKAEYIKQTLAPELETIGEGLLIGIKIPENYNKPASTITQKCLENGLIIGGSSDPKVLRIMPPLNITKTEIDKFARILKEAVQITNN